MSTELSLAARKQALRLARELRRGTPVVSFAGADLRRKKSLADLQAWCDAQGIGQPLRADGGWRFDPDTLKQLEQALQTLGLAPLDAAPAATRIGRLRQGAQEYKTLGEAPLQHRVLTSHALVVDPVPVNGAPARWVLDMDWRQLDLDFWDGLLVVENADVFYACGSADWPLPDALAGHLVVYRGHDHRAQGLRGLQQAWGRRAPQVYFGDIDPKGMSIALNEGYSHVLLPPFEQFARQASPFHAPAKQEASQRRLARLAPSIPAEHPLKAYMQVLIDGKGLLQQAVLQLPLTPTATILDGALVP